MCGGGTLRPVDAPVTATLSSVMPPIDLPPETPQDALRLDRLRPRAVVSLSTAPAHPAVIYVECMPQGPERPHGGEPTVRVLRDATGFASSSGDTEKFTTTVIHEPWRDSASTFIVEGIILDQKNLPRGPRTG